MSMANLIVQQDAGYLMTDSGYFRSDGTIAALHPKTMILPGLPVAIAAVGAFHLGYLAQEMEGITFPTVTAFLKSVGHLMQQAYKHAGMDPEISWGRLVIAFYSAEDDCVRGCTLFTGKAAGPSDLVPWRIYPTSEVIMPDVDRSSVLSGVALTDATHFNPATDALPLIHSQRSPQDWARGMHGCMVAGDIELTRVSRHGVKTIKLFSYPDAVGLLPVEQSVTGLNA